MIGTVLNILKLDKVHLRIPYMIKVELYIRGEHMDYETNIESTC